MSDANVNKARRNLLIGASSVVGAVGVVGAAIPFVASWNPSAKAKAAGAPVKIDISKLELGAQMVVEWRGKPVWIVRRTSEMIDALSNLNNSMADPDSLDARQPDYIPQDEIRAINPEYMVMIGLCTHLGCSPTYIPEVDVTDFGPNWEGGFYCPCHGSTFDLSGRVYKNKPAPTNLEIPPYFYPSKKVIVIGEDGDLV